MIKSGEISGHLPSLWEGKNVVKNPGVSLLPFPCGPPGHSLLGFMHFFQGSQSKALLRLGSFSLKSIGLCVNLVSNLFL